MPCYRQALAPMKNPFREWSSAFPRSEPRLSALHRVDNPLILDALLAANVPAHMGGEFNAFDWLSNEKNIALRIGDDLGMAEHHGEGLYEIHVWFASRGKIALTNARAMLAELFDKYGAKQAFCEPGMAHVSLFSRLLGFEYVRDTERPWGKVDFRVLMGNRYPLKPML